MTDHKTFQASHNDVEAVEGMVRLTGDDGLWTPLTPDEAIALGYALFSIGLTLKQSKG